MYVKTKVFARSRGTTQNGEWKSGGKRVDSGRDDVDHS